MTAPGWPEFAFWIASIERVRIVLIQRSSRGSISPFAWVCRLVSPLLAARGCCLVMLPAVGYPRAARPRRATDRAVRPQSGAGVVGTRDLRRRGLAGGGGVGDYDRALAPHPTGPVSYTHLRAHE